MTLEVDIRARVGAFMLEAAITARAGEVLAVIGPNGSGKSTLLGAIAGHHSAVDGRITLGGRTLDRSVPPERRRIGLLGQRPMLFPHLTALENVAFGPRAQGLPRGEALAVAHAQLADVGLDDLAQRRPAELSGGQQQRVALARALTAAPDALLLDEPFAALDAQTAGQARRLVSELRDRVGIPIVLVTHDPLDAVVLAARTVVLYDGRVAQQGTTTDVFGHPNSPFVAAVAGVNLLAGTADADGVLRGESGLRWAGHGDRLSPGDSGTAVFAPGSVRIRPASATADVANAWTGTVALMEPIPGGIRLFTAEHPDIAVDCPSSSALAGGARPGAQLGFWVADDDVSMRRSSAAVLP
ncbi:MAG: ABC transporter ATP-binding protein [Microbacterium sp.]|uniref:sulfate/molybdate ABC transporter ATP-binding protein n=1 Tax=Microbacterium sp. TaxID=51671 RepID=UPI003BB1784F